MGQSCRFARKRDLDPRSILECLRHRIINFSYLLVICSNCLFMIYISVSVTLFLVLCVTLMIS